MALSLKALLQLKSFLKPLGKISLALSFVFLFNKFLPKSSDLISLEKIISAAFVEVTVIE